ncbi:hypothetical protein EAG_07086 [Camponotus floridanus]|uniref:Uncharacterized protein n=1 Tax=Camponotus floridanus TaxID=104421 RepID=E2AJQ8_CAMFO|nr:hypothetical protein EAG_07086 [Camponotus floridanus]
MSRILSPGYRLILCANKPFRPGVKLSVTPERSPTRSLFRRCRRRRCRRRATKGEERTSGKRYERVWKRSGLERALMAANWPEKRPGREPDRCFSIIFVRIRGELEAVATHAVGREVAGKRRKRRGSFCVGLKQGLKCGEEPYLASLLRFITTANA